MNWSVDTLGEVWQFIIGPQLWLSIGKTTLKIFIIILLAFIISRIGNKIIGQLFKEEGRIQLRISSRREKTLKKLLQNVLSYIISFIALVMVLETFDVNIGALLAGAGIAGLAIGFGAQSLVKDVISGFFIIFEDQFSVGDYVTVAGVEGTVEEVGFRTTKVKSWTGEENIIPNGNITQVTNYSTHNGLSLVDINIPYESDIREAEKIIDEIIDKLPEKYDVFVKKPEVYGVQTLDLSYFVIRVIAETLPVYQWAGERIIRKEIKEQLYNKGIEIPSPRIVVYSRDKRNEQSE